jgi:hypothetical protein
MSDDVRNELIKVSPAAGVSMLSIGGVGLSDWVYLLTIVYLIVQILSLCGRGYCTYQDRRKNKDGEDLP